MSNLLTISEWGVHFSSRDVQNSQIFIHHRYSWLLDYLGSDLNEFLRVTAPYTLLQTALAMVCIPWVTNIF